ncbi:UvrD-helicase domain-containing protein [Nocardia blacklockiae]|uniref:UvrD-helicase domain-containing protein n=1 Tax=Nocardia blacklockiae TaxID=480036 RepID=UPI0018939EA8|nr:UvrD-helicase domain-containing protein [Nocardia blacklockiae]MBF6171113.1 AAA family ATPase [Nocardia blacklockiae]
MLLTDTARRYPVLVRVLEAPTDTTAPQAPLVVEELATGSRREYSWGAMPSTWRRLTAVEEQALAAADSPVIAADQLAVGDILIRRPEVHQEPEIVQVAETSTIHAYRDAAIPRIVFERIDTGARLTHTGPTLGPHWFRTTLATGAPSSGTDSTTTDRVSGEPTPAAVAPSLGGTDKGIAAPSPVTPRSYRQVRSGSAAFEAVVAEARVARAEAEKAGGHDRNAWLRFTDLLATDPRTGRTHSATSRSRRSLNEWWIQQAVVAYQDLGYRVEHRLPAQRQSRLAAQIDIDHDAMLVVVDAKLPAFTNAFNLIHNLPQARDHLDIDLVDSGNEPNAPPTGHEPPVPRPIADGTLNEWVAAGRAMFDPTHRHRTPNPRDHRDTALALHRRRRHHRTVEWIENSYRDGWYAASYEVTAPAWYAVRDTVARDPAIVEAVRRLGRTPELLALTPEFTDIVSAALDRAADTNPTAALAIRDARYVYCYTVSHDRWLERLAADIADHASTHARRDWPHPFATDRDLHQFRRWAAEQFRGDPLTSTALGWGYDEHRAGELGAVVATILTELPQQRPDIPVNLDDPAVLARVRAELYWEVLPALGAADRDPLWTENEHRWHPGTTTVAVEQIRGRWYVRTENGHRDCWGVDHRAALAQALTLAGHRSLIRPDHLAVHARIHVLRTALTDRARRDLAGHELLHAAVRSPALNALSTPDIVDLSAVHSALTTEAIRAVLHAIGTAEPVLLAEVDTRGLDPVEVVRTDLAADLLLELRRSDRDHTTDTDGSLFEPQTLGGDIHVASAGDSTIIVGDPDGHHLAVTAADDLWAIAHDPDVDAIADASTLSDAITQARNLLSESKPAAAQSITRDTTAKHGDVDPVADTPPRTSPERPAPPTAIDEPATQPPTTAITDPAPAAPHDGAPTQSDIKGTVAEQIPIGDNHTTSDNDASAEPAPTGDSDIERAAPSPETRAAHGTVTALPTWTDNTASSSTYDQRDGDQRLVPQLGVPDVDRALIHCTLQDWSHNCYGGVFDPSDIAASVVSTYLDPLAHTYGFRQVHAIATELLAANPSYPTTRWPRLTKRAEARRARADQLIAHAEALSDAGAYDDALAALHQAQLANCEIIGNQPDYEPSAYRARRDRIRAARDTTASGTAAVPDAYTPPWPPHPFRTDDDLRAWRDATVADLLADPLVALRTEHNLPRAHPRLLDEAIDLALDQAAQRPPPLRDDVTDDYVRDWITAAVTRLYPRHSTPEHHPLWEPTHDRWRILNGSNISVMPTGSTWRVVETDQHIDYSDNWGSDHRAAVAEAYRRAGRPDLVPPAAGTVHARVAAARRALADLAGPALRDHEMVHAIARSADLLGNTFRRGAAATSTRSPLHFAAIADVLDQLTAHHPAAVDDLTATGIDPTAFLGADLLESVLHDLFDHYLTTTPADMPAGDLHPTWDGTVIVGDPHGDHAEIASELQDREISERRGGFVWVDRTGRYPIRETSFTAALAEARARHAARTSPHEREAADEPDQEIEPSSRTTGPAPASRRDIEAGSGDDPSEEVPKKSKVELTLGLTGPDDRYLGYIGRFDGDYDIEVNGVRFIFRLPSPIYNRKNIGVWIAQHDGSHPPESWNWTRWSAGKKIATVERHEQIVPAIRKHLARNTSPSARSRDSGTPASGTQLQLGTDAADPDIHDEQRPEPHGDNDSGSGPAVDAAGESGPLLFTEQPTDTRPEPEVDSGTAPPAPAAPGPTPAASSAAMLEGESYPPSPQQQAVYDAVLAGSSVKIQAGAGAGKTSTLKGCARRIGRADPNAKIVYIAFNKTVQLEAAAAMPANVEARTGHSIAVVWGGKKRQNRLDSNTALRKPDAMARHLGLRQALTAGPEPPLSPAEQAVAAMRTVAAYANSADDDIGAQHLPERLRQLPASSKQRLLTVARAAWTDLVAETGQLKLTHDHIRKMWALSRPDFTRPGSGLKRPATIVFLDEAQDTPPVLRKVVGDQTGVQTVIVGDENQAIYGFTGAVNALAELDAEHRLPLTVSWRFGSGIAEIGNRFLQLLDTDMRIQGGGPASEIVSPGSMASPEAILVRSNSGAITEIARQLDADRVVGVPKGTKGDLTSLVDTTRYLQGHGPHPSRVLDELAPYRTWDEVVADAERGDDPKLSMLVRIVDQNGLDTLGELVQQIHELGAGSMPGLTFRDADYGLVAGRKAYDYRHILARAGFELEPLPDGQTITKGKYAGRPARAWIAFGTPAERQAKLARAHELAGGPTPDVIISTAHKAKGLEWDSVRVGDDFKGPVTDPQSGELIMPSHEELCLAYVAVTRARRTLDPGGLAYVFDHTTAEKPAPTREVPAHTTLGATPDHHAPVPSPPPLASTSDDTSDTRTELGSPQPDSMAPSSAGDEHTDHPPLPHDPPEVQRDTEQPAASQPGIPARHQEHSSPNTEGNYRYEAVWQRLIDPEIPLAPADLPDAWALIELATRNRWEIRGSFLTLSGHVAYRLRARGFVEGRTDERQWCWRRDGDRWELDDDNSATGPSGSGTLGDVLQRRSASVPADSGPVLDEIVATVLPSIATPRSDSTGEYRHYRDTQSPRIAAQITQTLARIIDRSDSQSSQSSDAHRVANALRANTVARDQLCAAILDRAWLRTSLTDDEQARIRCAVDDFAYTFPFDHVRYTTETYLRDVAAGDRSGPIWAAVAADIATRPDEVLHCTKPQADARKSAREALVPATEAAIAAADTDRARILLRALATHDPRNDHTPQLHTILDDHFPAAPPPRPTSNENESPEDPDLIAAAVRNGWHVEPPHTSPQARSRVLRHVQSDGTRYHLRLVWNLTDNGPVYDAAQSRGSKLSSDGISTPRTSGLRLDIARNIVAATATAPADAAHASDGTETSDSATELAQAHALLDTDQRLLLYAVADRRLAALLTEPGPGIQALFHSTLGPDDPTRDVPSKVQIHRPAWVGQLRVAAGDIFHRHSQGGTDYPQISRDDVERFAHAIPPAWRRRISTATPGERPGLLRTVLGIDSAQIADPTALFGLTADERYAGAADRRSDRRPALAVTAGGRTFTVCPPLPTDGDYGWDVADTSDPARENPASAQAFGVLLAGDVVPALRRYLTLTGSVGGTRRRTRDVEVLSADQRLLLFGAFGPWHLARALGTDSDWYISKITFALHHSHTLREEVFTHRPAWRACPTYCVDRQGVRLEPSSDTAPASAAAATVTPAALKKFRRTLDPRLRARLANHETLSDSELDRLTTAVLGINEIAAATGSPPAGPERLDMRSDSSQPSTAPPTGATAEPTGTATTRPDRATPPQPPGREPPIRFAHIGSDGTATLRPDLAGQTLNALAEPHTEHTPAPATGRPAERTDPAAPDSAHPGTQATAPQPRSDTTPPRTDRPPTELSAGLARRPTKPSGGQGARTARKPRSSRRKESPGQLGMFDITADGGIDPALIDPGGTPLPPVATDRRAHLPHVPDSMPDVPLSEWSTTTLTPVRRSSGHVTYMRAAAAIAAPFTPDDVIDQIQQLSTIWFARLVDALTSSDPATLDDLTASRPRLAQHGVAVEVTKKGLTLQVRDVTHDERPVRRETTIAWRDLADHWIRPGLTDQRRDILRRSVDQRLHYGTGLEAFELLDRRATWDQATSELDEMADRVRSDILTSAQHPDADPTAPSDLAQMITRLDQLASLVPDQWESVKSVHAVQPGDALGSLTDDRIFVVQQPPRYTDTTAELHGLELHRDMGTVAAEPHARTIDTRLTSSVAILALPDLPLPAPTGRDATPTERRRTAGVTDRIAAPFTGDDVAEMIERLPTRVFSQLVQALTSTDPDDLKQFAAQTHGIDSAGRGIKIARHGLEIDDRDLASPKEHRTPRNVVIRWAELSRHWITPGLSPDRVAVLNRSTEIASRYEAGRSIFAVLQQQTFRETAQRELRDLARRTRHDVLHTALHGTDDTVAGTPELGQALARLDQLAAVVPDHWETQRAVADLRPGDAVPRLPGGAGAILVLSETPTRAGDLYQLRGRWLASDAAELPPRFATATVDPATKPALDTISLPAVPMTWRAAPLSSIEQRDYERFDTLVSTWRTWHAPLDPATKPATVRAVATAWNTLVSALVPGLEQIGDIRRPDVRSDVEVDVTAAHRRYTIRAGTDLRIDTPSPAGTGTDTIARLKFRDAHTILSHIRHDLAHRTAEYAWETVHPGLHRTADLRTTMALSDGEHLHLDDIGDTGALLLSLRIGGRTFHLHEPDATTTSWTIRDADATGFGLVQADSPADILRTLRAHLHAPTTPARTPPPGRPLAERRTDGGAAQNVAVVSRETPEALVPNPDADASPGARTPPRRFATVAAARAHLEAGVLDPRWKNPPRVHNEVAVHGAGPRERAQVRIDTYSARPGMEFARLSELSPGGHFLVTREGHRKWHVYHIGSGTIMTHQAGHDAKPDALRFATELDAARDEHDHPIDWAAPFVGDRLDMAGGRTEIELAVDRGRTEAAHDHDHPAETGPAEPLLIFDASGAHDPALTGRLPKVAQDEHGVPLTQWPRRDDLVWAEKPDGGRVRVPEGQVVTGPGVSPTPATSRTGIDQGHDRGHPGVSPQRGETVAATTDFTAAQIALLRCVIEDQASELYRQLEPSGFGEEKTIAQLADSRDLEPLVSARGRTTVTDMIASHIAAHRGEVLLCGDDAVEARRKARRDEAGQLRLEARQLLGSGRFGEALRKIDHADLAEPLYRNGKGVTHDDIRAAIRRRAANAGIALDDPAVPGSAAKPRPADEQAAEPSDPIPSAPDSSKITPADDDRADMPLPAVTASERHPGPITVPSGKRARAQANLAALELVDRLEAEQRTPTPEERQILLAWSGWGAVQEIFDKRLPKWKPDRERLRNLLTPDEYDTAQGSVLNAHYTDPAIASAIFTALERAGFRGGPVLEPGCGVGTFIGLAPPTAQMVGVEVDSGSAHIAHHLYPDALIRLEGFETTRLPDNSFVATVGNVPFGKYVLHDPAYNQAGHSIHNHFILKSLALTAPGGYVAVITSAWTMDSTNAAARDEILRSADFLGAVRLPGKAFNRVAGTQVVTDILLLRKHEPGIDPVENRPQPTALRNLQFRGTSIGTFTYTPDVANDDEEATEVKEKLRLSTWYAKRRDCVLGELGVGHGLYADGSLTVTSPDLDTLPAQVTAALSELVDTARRERLGFTARARDVTESPLSTTGLLVYRPEARFENPIAMMRYHSGQFEAVTEFGTWEPVKVFATRAKETRALLDLRDRAFDVIATQRGDAHGPAEREQARTNLNAAYDAYVRQYGPVSRFTWHGGKERTQAQHDRRYRELETKWRKEYSGDEGERFTGELPPEVAEQLDTEAWQTTARVKKRQHLEGAIGRDPTMAAVLALEHYSDATGAVRKAAIFTRDIAAPALPTYVDEPGDALSISLARGRGVDLPYIAQLLAVDVDTARTQLVGRHVFADPADPDRLIPANKYLSGNVREKLEIARAAATENSALDANVTALQQALPPWQEAAQIRVRAGAVWIDSRDYAQFAQETFGLNVAATRKGPRWRFTANGRNAPSAKAKSWGVGDEMGPLEIFERVCNSADIAVETKGDNGSRYVDWTATAQAQAQADRMRTEFQRWIWSDDARRERLVAEFNTRFNSFVRPRHDGRYFQVAGLSRTPYDYQRDAAMGMVAEPTRLLDMVVGAGKTGTFSMGAMKLRESGLVSQPWLVVPNHLPESIGLEIKKWFPAANLLIIPSKLTAEQRRRAVAQTATSDWDLVVVAQSTFEKIPVHPLRRQAYVKEQLAELEDHLLQAQDDDDRASMKDLMRSKKGLEKRLAKMLAAEDKDTGLTFEQSGCDYLIIDEAHHYKNKSRIAAMRELNMPEGAGKAEDLYMKIQVLFERAAAQAITRGAPPDIDNMRIATFATGTRVANAMAEEWVMQNYLRPDLLEHAGVEDIGAWGSVFTTTKSVITTNPTGTRLVSAEKIAKYTNLRRLLDITRMFTDVVTRDQVPVDVTIEGGQRTIIATPASQEVRDFIADLDWRMENYKPTEAWKDNPLKVLNDGRNAALDPQLVGLAPDPVNSRARIVADHMLTDYAATRHNRYRDEDGSEHPAPGGLLIGFCDRGTPDGVAGDASFYHTLRRYLIAGNDSVPEGIPPEKIRFAHDAKKPSERLQLEQDCNNGGITVLLGSTEKMGTGLNIQSRAVGLYHIDIPWRPADLKQREGRIIRQGNQNPTVFIKGFVTEGTTDAIMWSTVEEKAIFIDQLHTGDIEFDEMEDPNGDDIADAAAIAKAAASGDPRFLRLAELDRDIIRLTGLEDAAADTHHRAHRDLQYKPTDLARKQAALQLVSQHVRAAAAWADNPGILAVHGRRLSDRGGANRALLAAARAAFLDMQKEANARNAQPEPRQIAEIDGHPVNAGYSLGSLELVIGDLQVGTYMTRDELFPSAKKDPASLEAPVSADDRRAADAATARGLTQRINNAYAKLPTRVHELQAAIQALEADIDYARSVVDKPFEHAEELTAAKAERSQLRLDIEATLNSPEAIAARAEHDERQRRHGRAPGWSLALNPTKATVADSGLGSRENYIAATRAEQHAKATEYVATLSHAHHHRTVGPTGSNSATGEAEHDRGTEPSAAANTPAEPIRPTTSAPPAPLDPAARRRQMQHRPTTAPSRHPRP